MASQPEHVQTSHPGRKIGRLPKHTDETTHPRLKLGAFLRSGYTGQVPDVVDYSGVAHWPMYRNDELGNCTAAAAGHAEQVWSTYGTGTTVTVSDDDVLAFYEGSTGYDPRDPSTDQGGVMQDVLAYWRKTGLAGHRIEAFFEVDPGDADELRAALFLLGSVNIGMAFPAFAMGQTDSGLPWDVSRRNTQLEGGHDVLLVKMTKGGNYVVVTWGQLQEVTPAFWAKYMAGRDGEAWGMAEQEFAASGRAANGLDVAALNTAFEELTGQPGPFVGGAVPPAPPAENPPATDPPATDPPGCTAFLTSLRDQITTFLGKG